GHLAGQSVPFRPRYPWAFDAQYRRTVRIPWLKSNKRKEQVGMASISTSKATGKRRIKFVGADRNPSTIHLGTVTRKVADEVKSKVEAVLAATRHKVSLDAETASWLARIDDALYGKLVSVGLVAERTSKKRVRLAEFLDSYIELRADLKPNT